MSTYTKEEIKDLMRDVLQEREEKKMDEKYQRTMREYCIVILMSTIFTAVFFAYFPPDSTDSIDSITRDD